MIGRHGQGDSLECKCIHQSPILHRRCSEVRQDDCTATPHDTLTCAIMSPPCGADLALGQTLK